MSDFATANLLIENMDAGLDGPLSSREVACVEKGWVHGEKSASAEIARLQSEVERLRGRCGELESNIQQFVCSGTGAVADAENKFLSAVILRKQAEAVEAFGLSVAEGDLDDSHHGDLTHGDVQTLSDVYAQRLRQQAAESEEVKNETKQRSVE